MSGFKGLTDADRAYLDKVADAMPPLTDAQRARLRPLLAGTIPAPAGQAAA